MRLNPITPFVNLETQTILVTGGAGNGVGEGVCQVLSAQGASLVINDLSPQTAASAAALYPNAVGIAADISRPNEIETLFEQARQHFGTITGLVNNAGIGLHQEAHRASIGAFDHLYQVDVRGLWLCSREFVKQLQQDQQSGNIVNISSVHAQATMKGYGIYASAKSAVEGLTRGMAVEVGPLGVRVNAVAPGYVFSEQSLELISTWSDDPHAWVKRHSHNYQALPHEINHIDCGNVVAFLLSNLSRSITGQSIRVDNGTTCLLYDNAFIEEKRH